MANVIILIFLFSFCSNLISCNWNARGDWSYNLPNGYKIMRVNSTDIVLVASDYCLIDEKGYLTNTMVERYITCFCYNAYYVAVRRIDVSNDMSFEDIVNKDSDSALFYLVNTETNELNGPYSTLEDFENACMKFEIVDLCDWIDTYPAPEGAIY